MRNQTQITAEQTILSDSIINKAIMNFLHRGWGVDIAKAVKDLEEMAQTMDGEYFVFDNEVVALEWAMETIHEHGYVRPPRENMPEPYVVIEK
jgi:hypothetical protein